MSIQTVLMRVEGTACPGRYRREVLLPFARRRLLEFLREHFTDPDITHAIGLLEQHGMAARSAEMSRVEGLPIVAEWCLDLMTRDVDSEGVAIIQSLIWKQGFHSGELSSEVFADVPPALQRWRTQGLTIATWSRDTALTQELLFRYSEWGDLTPYIKFFFDLHMGPGNAAATYQNILYALRQPPAEILVISQGLEQLAAARDAGMVPVLLARDMMQPSSVKPNYRVVQDLRDVLSS